MTLLSLSQAVAEAVDNELRGVIYQAEDRTEIKVLVAFDALWTTDIDGNLVRFAPSVPQATEHRWVPSNDI